VRSGVAQQEEKRREGKNGRRKGRKGSREQQPYKAAAGMQPQRQNRAPEQPAEGQVVIPHKYRRSHAALQKRSSTRGRR